MVSAARRCSLRPMKWYSWLLIAAASSTPPSLSASPGAPALQPPALGTAPDVSDGDRSTARRRRRRSPQPGRNIRAWVGRAGQSVSELTGSENDGRCEHSIAMTRVLLNVCAPTSLRCGNLGGLAAPSRRDDPLAGVMGEREPSCATLSWTLASHPTSRAASATCRADFIHPGVPDLPGWTPSPPHHFIDARSVSGSLTEDGPTFSANLRVRPRGQRCAGSFLLAAFISNILLSQNVTQYTKMTRDCLHELATLLFSISGKLCIGYAG